MKNTHIAALVCFGIALFFYLAAASSAAGGGFAFLGFIFEMMAWRKASGSDEENK
jgi:hypothetical protein